MKLLQSIILTVLMVIFYSCSSMDEPQAPDQVEETKVAAISQDEAISVAMNAMKNFGFISPSRSDVSASDVEVTTHSTEKEDTAFYVVSYPEGGFVAVDANGEALAKVLAISDKGKMSEAGIKYLSNARPRLLPPGIIKPDPVLPITPGNVSKVYSHITPEWGQDEPYNSAFVKNKSVGAEILSIGETLAYFRKSITVDGKPFDWTGIDPFDPAEEDFPKISKFLKQIASDMNAKATGNYLIKFDSIACNLKKYGYNNCRYFSFGTGEDFPDRFKKGPVLAHATLVDGTEFTWVVDEIEYTKQKLDLAIGIGGEAPTITSMYMTMNWGCYGEGNGFYLTYYYDSSKGINETYDWHFTTYGESMVAIPENTEFLSVE